MTIPDSTAEADLVQRLRDRIAALEQLIEVEQKRSHPHLQLARRSIGVCCPHRHEPIERT